MTTRENATVQTSGPDIVVIGRPAQPAGSPAPEAPAPPGSPRPSSRLLLWLVVAAVALAAVTAAAVAGLRSGDEDAVAQPVGEQPAQLPAAPAALQVSADAPSSATVGDPVTITVTYSDGSGIFSGTSEDWGDGVGTSSQREGLCTAADAAPGALSDTYRLVHTWTEPGTYAVTIGVHSYSCQGTAAVQEQATTVLNVQVLAR